MSDHETLGDVIGHVLAADASPAQREKLEEAMRENADGLRREAAEVLEAISRGDVDRAVPALLARCRRGKHRLHAAARDQTRRSDLDRVEAAYHTRHAKYPELGQDDAIEYAIDYHAPGDHDLEHELRQRAGQSKDDRPATPAEAARWLRIIGLQLTHCQNTPWHPLRRAAAERLPLVDLERIADDTLPGKQPDPRLVRAFAAQHGLPMPTLLEASAHDEPIAKDDVIGDRELVEANRAQTEPADPSEELLPL